METQFKKWDNMNKRERVQYQFIEKMNELITPDIQEIIDNHCTQFNVSDPFIMRTMHHNERFLIDTSENKNIKNGFYKAFYLIIKDSKE